MVLENKTMQRDSRQLKNCALKIKTIYTFVYSKFATLEFCTINNIPIFIELCAKPMMIQFPHCITICHKQCGKIVVIVNRYVLTYKAVFYLRYNSTNAACQTNGL